MIRPMTIAAFGLVTACAAQTHNDVYTELQPSRAAFAAGESRQAEPEAPFAAGVSCDIRATRTPDGVRLEAVVYADQAARGAYDFVITALSSSGSSDVTQGGPFDLSAGRSTTVGVAEISQSRYRAVLTLNSEAGELCRLERSS